MRRLNRAAVFLAVTRRTLDDQGGRPIPPAQNANTKVTLTICDGKITYHQA
jgi:hypothetical protein